MPLDNDTFYKGVRVDGLTVTGAMVPVSPSRRWLVRP